MSLFTFGLEATPERVSLWEDWLDGIRVETVTDFASWGLALEAARSAGVCALDLETVGLDPLVGKVRLVQLAVPVGSPRVVDPSGRRPAPGSSCVVWVADLFRLPEAEVLESLAGLVGDPGVLKVGHNLKFDLAFLRAALGGRRLAAERLFDTMLASQLITAGDFIPESQFERWCRENGVRVEKRGSERTRYFDVHGHELLFERDVQKKIRPVYPTHSLQQIAHRHLEVWLEKEHQSADWGGEVTPEMLRYAARDAAVLLPLKEVLEALLVRNGLVDVAKIEFACLPAVAEVELSGMSFDAAGARERLVDAEVAAGGARVVLAAMAKEAGFCPRQKKTGGAAFNADSGLDCLDMLCLLASREGVLVGDRFAVDGEEFAADTRDETLGRLAARLPEGSTLRRFAESLRAYRAAKKRVDFLKKWLQLVRRETGRLHPDLRQINPQGVGRFSASSPNLQQVARGSDIRSLFRAPAGRRLVVADYSGIEMRIMAQLSRDENLVSAFKSDVDIHRFTAARMAGKSPDEVTKEERQAAKSFNFGLIYGMQEGTLRVYAETSYGVKMTLEEAEAARRAFFRVLYPGVASWHRAQDARGFEEGFEPFWRHDHARGFYREMRPCVRTLGGRLRVWPVVEERSNGGVRRRKAGSFTELYNTPDQGTGADMIKCAMARLYRELLKRGWEDMRLVATVHDELVLEAPEKLAEQAAELLGAVMEAAGARFLPDVPVEVETAVCESWAEK